MLPRSYLYVPGDDQHKVARAGSRGADAVILDLEDGVAPAARAVARRQVRETLAAGVVTSGEVWVRVNPGDLADDLAAVTVPGLTGVVVPKAEPVLLAEVDRELAAAEERAGLPVGGVAVIALLETAVGLLSVADVARAPRVRRLGLGEADLIGELRLRPSPDRDELAPLRLSVVVASAAAGIAPPVGPVETDLADTDRLRRTSRALAALGFTARTALHPKQVPVIHEVFTPDTAEVARARQIVDAFDAAAARGSAVAVTADGRFVDPAVVRAARHTLAAHEAARAAAMAQVGDNERPDGSTLHTRRP